MPELPEVETIGRSLAPHIVGKKIVNVECFVERLRNELNPKEMQEQLINRTITKWQRIGKYLLYTLDNDFILLMHFAMTGTCKICNKEDPRDKFEHIVWILDDNTSWRFSDIRRFGQVLVVKKYSELPNGVRNIGIDPLSEEFNAEWLFNATRKITKSLKILLLDQYIIAGLGNIYVNEAMWMSKLSPNMAGRDLTLANCKLLAPAIKKILLQSIEAGGTTISDFRRPDGSEGKFALNLQVYGQTGKPCSNCSTLIERCVTGGRSTWFCPKCQKQKK